MPWRECGLLSEWLSWEVAREIARAPSAAYGRSTARSWVNGTHSVRLGSTAARRQGSPGQHRPFPNRSQTDGAHCRQFLLHDVPDIYRLFVFDIDICLRYIGCLVGNVLWHRLSGVSVRHSARGWGAAREEGLVAPQYVGGGGWQKRCFYQTNPSLRITDASATSCGRACCEL
jgi:hypothetical protein